MNWGAEIVFLVVVFLAAVFGLPPTVEDLRQGDKSLPMREDEPLETEIFTAQEPREEESLGLRFRRVTCDILSVSTPFGSLNHSACAAHCLAKMKGFAGGRCIEGVCHCRK